MLRQSVSELTITVKISGGPVLLIKDGRFNDKKDWIPRKEDRKSAPSAIPISRSPESALRAVVTSKERLTEARKLEFYLPASSIRGAWRAHLEKVLRSLDDAAPRVCDPLIADEEQGPAGPYLACSRVLVNEDDERVKVPYRASCPVCRLFGNTAQASRLSFGDAELSSFDLAEVDNVAISRQTGAVHSPFRAMVLRNARARLKLRLRNFELWQAALLGHLFDDLRGGLVPLGSGKNKGWGANTAEAVEIRLTYFGQDRGRDGRLRGLGEILDQPRCKDYGLAPERSAPAIQASRLDGESAMWRHVYEVQDASAFWGSVKPFFDDRLWQGMPSLADRRPPDGGAAKGA